MGLALLEKHFGQIGARVKLGEAIDQWPFRRPAGIDIGRDQRGEFFDIRLATNEPAQYEVVDLKPDLRHLLLLGRQNEQKHKFLCGHDERHWFVCAVPGNGISNVIRAMEALQPREVKWQVHRRVKRAKDRLARHNEAFTRQGEWFFVPAPNIPTVPRFVLRNEPISRGNGSKSHMCEKVFRFAGEPVMVSQRHPQGLTLDQHASLIKADRQAQRLSWKRMQRGAAVFARGKVRHPDHKTVVLDGWHRVYMNTENLAPGARSVVFLD